MNRSATGLALGLLAVVSLEAAAQPTPEARSAALAAIRQAAASRGDVDAINGKVAAARQLQGEPAFDRELARLEEMTGYLLRFWEHAEGVAKRLESGKELVIGEQRVAVVEYANGSLVLRVAGQNKSYSKKTMPARLVLTLATQELNAADPGTKIFIGAFLALDGKGDRKLARQYWDEAAKAGQDIARFLPELEIPQPPLPAELPAMSPAVRGQLAERNFTLRRKKEGAWVREPSGDVLTQNAEGRLELRMPAGETTPVQVITKRGFTGDFQCALIVQADRPLVVGVFSAADGDIGRTVSVPAGTFLVEIARAGGKFTFKVGEREVQPTVLADEKPRTPLAIGLQLTPGAAATLAALETAGR